jgi:protocatechuate 3,4-dioxygenase beta subunit
MNPHRRRLVAGTTAFVALPALAAGRVFVEMTNGPFYPPPAWRARWSDWDADLTRVQRDGRALVARGEHMALELAVADSRSRAIDGAEVEIWQCDALQAYRHPGVAQEPGRFDEGFQGFGAGRSGAAGTLAMRTIRPVPYPSRTPHIHVKLRHPSFGERTSQLFVAGDPGNPRDFLWRGLAPADREALDMKVEAAPAGSGLRWQARHTLVVPA